MIIGLVGPAGCGKSTAAAALELAGFVRVRMADPLKGMLRCFYVQAGLEADEVERRIEGDLKEVPDPLLLGVTPRRAMQTIGTDWGRDMIAPDLWTNAWAERARRLQAVGHSVVCEDVRFPNEAATLRALGGVIVKIERPDHGNPAAGHSSEGQLIDVDALVINGGSLMTLGAKITMVADDLRGQSRAA